MFVLAQTSQSKSLYDKTNFPRFPIKNSKNDYAVTHWTYMYFDTIYVYVHVDVCVYLELADLANSILGRKSRRWGPGGGGEASRVVSYLRTPTGVGFSKDLNYFRQRIYFFLFFYQIIFF